MTEEIRSLHRVNVKINSAGNWVSESEVDTRDIYGGLKNIQTLKRRRETMAALENRVWSCNLQARGLSNGKGTNKRQSVSQNSTPKPNAKILWIGHWSGHCVLCYICAQKHQLRQTYLRHKGKQKHSEVSSWITLKRMKTSIALVFPP